MNDGGTALQQNVQRSLVAEPAMVERLEVIAGPTGRRNWPDAVKARIVAESFARDARVSDVARRHGLQPQQLTTWRRLAREGKLALPDDDERLDFASLVVETPSGDDAAPIELEVEGVIVRLPGDSATVRIAEIAAALRAAL